MADELLSTIDNPYNPHTQWRDWETWDRTVGRYNTLSLQARVTRDSDALSETDHELAIQAGMEEVVFYNVSGVHILVPKPANLND